MKTEIFLSCGKSDPRRTVSAMISLLCLLCIAAGINRKFPFGILKATAIDLMKVTDLLPMLFFVPLSLICLVLIINAYQGFQRPWILITFVIGTFALGCGFGMHDPFNAILMRVPENVPQSLRASMIFFDDKFGHWLFFAGFILVSLSVSCSELANPAERDFHPFFLLFLYSISALVALAIWKNMIHEETSTDIAVLFATCAILIALQAISGNFRLRRMPVLSATYLAYGGGAILSVLTWILF